MASVGHWHKNRNSVSRPPTQGRGGGRPELAQVGAGSEGPVGLPTSAGLPEFPGCLLEDWSLEAGAGGARQTPCFASGLRAGVGGWGAGGKGEVNVRMSDCDDESGPWDGNICCGNPTGVSGNLVTSARSGSLETPRGARLSRLPELAHCLLAVCPPRHGCPFLGLSPHPLSSRQLYQEGHGDN